MAFKIVANEDVSMFLRPNDITTKSFIAGRDPEPLFAAPLPPGQGIRRNLHSDFFRCENDEAEEESVSLPPPSSKDMVRVFLRIKPRTEEESHYYSIASSNQDDSDSSLALEKKTTADPSVSNVGIESEYQLAITAPPDSNAYKNSINQGNGKLTHRFTFTKIFPQLTEQAELFDQIVKPRLQDFLEGRNQLLFTYGATSSGKTFTIQGDSKKPGILPRTLDVLFNSVGSRKICQDDLNIKPLGYNRVGALLPREKEKLVTDKKTIIDMGAALTQEVLDGTGSSDNCSDDTQNSIASLKSRCRDEDSIDINERSLHYAIWVSFAEIYNENTYDLFEKLPEVRNKGDKPRRLPLKLADDKGGWVYIKGLKEVPVSSADEAYQLLQIGRQNLRFAATKLNHNSSRSHCIFTVKMVRVADKDQPHMARVSMLSFCDLAGSERIKKTMNTGDRQKEAGNINTSLLVLGRCIKAIRHNQMIKDVRKHQIIPYRDSKLTRLFQSYFTGCGKVSMIVNISQSSYLFDETLQVLKFSAIASKVHVQQIKEPRPMEAKRVAEKAKRKTRFSIMVENNKNVGRGSIAWENPQFRSTICPRPESDQTCIEEEEDGYADVTNMAEETVIDTKYDGLLKLIDNLKNQLIEEKQKNLKLEAETRTELCEEFNKMMVDIETSWEQRLQEEKDRASELSDWRIGKLEEALQNQQKRNRKSENERKDEQTEMALQGKDDEITDLKEELSVIKKLHSTQLEENKKTHGEVDTLKSTLKTLGKTKTDLDEKVEALQKELLSTNEALKSQNADPKIAELETMVTEFRKRKEEDDKQITDLKVLLDEAGEDYLAKNREIKGLQSKITSLKKINDEKDEQVQDLDHQGDELKALLSQATSRADEKELLIFEMEEKVETLSVQLEQYKADEEEKWSTKKASEQEITNLNDEIESLKTEKKKMRALVDSRDADLASKDTDIDNLERETKSLIKSNAKFQGEVQELRKQLNNTSAMAADGEKSLQEKTSMISHMQTALDARKKEDTAIDALSSELDSKRKESEELQFKVKELQANVEAKEYDVKRAKDDRDRLMSHYDSEIKKMNDKLSLEKRETSKLRELMQNTTPMKKDSSSEKELNMLREEVTKKSELIKSLAARVTTPKRNTANIDEEQPCCNTLKKEIETLKEKHVKDLEKQQSRHEKVIAEFKDTNAELLKHVPANASKQVMNTKRTVEDSEDENVPPSKADNSLIVATPGVVAPRHQTKRGRSKKASKSKLSRTTQVSFADSTIDSTCHFEDSSTTDLETSKAKRPKRGSKISKSAQQSRKNQTAKNEEIDASVESAAVLNATEPLATARQKLDSISGQTLPQFQTPATNRKRKLFTLTPRPEVYTPQDEEDGPVESPHTLVKRQLRTRQIKIKR